MSLKRAGLTGRLNNQPRFTGRRITLNRVSLRRFPFPSAPAAPEAVYVEDVYSTYLYTGTGTTQSIPNNIRLGDGATSSGWITTLSIPSTTTSTYGRSVAVDGGGNVYVCGELNTTLSTELFIAKYNSSGIFQWQKSIGGANNSSGYAVSVDNNNNVYVCGGSTQGSPATDDFLIAKYNPSGTLQWQVRLGNTTAAQTAEGIKTDGSGNIYVVGYTGNVAGGFDVQLAKYDTTGAIQWQRSLGLGGTAFNFGRDIAVDSSGNCYITGQEVVSTNDRLLTAKYDTNGVLQWQRRLTGSSTSDRGQGVAVDSSGNVYVSAFSNTNNIDYNDFIIAKYNTSGVLQWQRRLGTDLKTSFGMSAAVDGSGNVYVNGYSGDSPSGSNRMLIVKYDTSGVLQWQRRLGFSATSFQGTSVAVDTSGMVYICGNGQAEAGGKYVTILAKLPGDGSGTGGYSSAGSFLMYEASSLTNSAATLANSAAGLNNTATTFSNTTSIATETTGNLTSSLVSITTGTGFGGLVWIKSRSGVTGHRFTDTTRGATKSLNSSSDGAEATESTGLTSFNSTGFTIDADADYNNGGDVYASWTFRKQAKFFDVVTYTGNGVAGRTVAHNLGSVPGCIIVKRLNNTGGWRVYHRSLGATQDLSLEQNITALASSTVWNDTAPTATVFSVGTNVGVNGNGSTYVAYLFAHDAGGFGATGTDNVITCGSYTGTGADPGPTITLGYEPQWVLIKIASGTPNDWVITDNMRGSIARDAGSTRRDLLANLTDAENNFFSGTISPSATGFTIASNNNKVNELNSTYIYIAIRRGPMRTPTSGTEVFQPVVYTGTNVDNRRVITNILTDMIMARQRSSTAVTGFVVGDRLRNNQYLTTGATAAGVTDADSLMSPTTVYGTAFSDMNGFGVGNDATSQLNISTVVNNQIVEAFKRAPGFLDIVTYTGTGNARTISHNLGVVPQMMWVKETSTADNWVVYTQMTGPGSYGSLDNNTGVTGSPTRWNNTVPTTSVFSVGASADTNSNGVSYVAYLMGNIPGVVNLSYYVGLGVGTSQQVDCGFTSGARFIMLKNFNASRPWYVYDSARGISSGNDPWLATDSTAAENTATDYIDPYSGGFEISATAPDDLNVGYGQVMNDQAGVDGVLTLSDIVYGGGLWVAISSGGNVSRSVTGYGWTTVTSVIGTGNGVTFGNGLYVVVGGSGAIATSPDAITWTSRTSGVSVALNSAAYAFGKYWAVGNGGTVLSSTDGITWSSVSSGTTNVLRQIRLLNNNLVIVGNSGTIVTSADGVTFTVRTSGTTNDLRGVAFGAGLYVVVGVSGTVRTSPDFVTWTARTGLTGTLTNIVWASYRFVVQSSAPAIWYSADGITWTSGTSMGTNGYQGMWFANDIIVIGSGDGDIYISDPRVWYWAIA